MTRMSGSFSGVAFGDYDKTDEETEWSGFFTDCTFTNIDFRNWYDARRFTNCQFYGCWGIPQALNLPIDVN